MLTVTPIASQVIHQLLAGGDSDGRAGLRIAPTDEPAGSFSLGLAAAPEAEDQVIPLEEGEVFLEPRAAEALDDKVLDAEVDSQGQVSFSVIDQEGS